MSLDLMVAILTLKSAHPRQRRWHALRGRAAATIWNRL